MATRESSMAGACNITALLVLCSVHAASPHARSHATAACSVGGEEDLASSTRIVSVHTINLRYTIAASAYVKVRLEGGFASRDLTHETYSKLSWRSTAAMVG